jgi:hypothetical protein
MRMSGLCNLEMSGFMGGLEVPSAPRLPILSGSRDPGTTPGRVEPNRRIANSQAVAMSGSSTLPLYILWVGKVVRTGINGMLGSRMPAKLKLKTKVQYCVQNLGSGDLF